MRPLQKQNEPMKKRRHKNVTRIENVFIEIVDRHKCFNFVFKFLARTKRQYKLESTEQTVDNWRENSLSEQISLIKLLSQIITFSDQKTFFFSARSRICWAEKDGHYGLIWKRMFFFLQVDLMKSDHRIMIFRFGFCFETQEEVE